MCCIFRAIGEYQANTWPLRTKQKFINELSDQSLHEPLIHVQILVKLSKYLEQFKWEHWDYCGAEKYENQKDETRVRYHLQYQIKYELVCWWEFAKVYTQIIFLYEIYNYFLFVELYIHGGFENRLVKFMALY